MSNTLNEKIRSYDDVGLRAINNNFDRLFNYIRFTNIDARVKALALLNTGGTVSGNITASALLRLLLTNNATLTSENHPLQIGPSSGRNLRADTLGIMSVNNTAAAALQFNYYGGNVHVGYGDGVTSSLTVNKNTVLHRGLIHKLLWGPGAWNSGVIGVTEFDLHNFFILEPSGYNAPILAVKMGTLLIGIGTYQDDTSRQDTIHFKASFSGTDLTWGSCRSLQHPASAVHSAASSRTIANIYGIA